MHRTMQTIDTIIFDLGGVLIDGDPKYLYRQVFDNDEQKMNWFLGTICTNEWNLEQDAGRTLKEGTELLVEQFPTYEALIRMYYDQWTQMLGGPISGTVALLKQLKYRNVHTIYALTNWSAETFPQALERFDFLQDFAGIVVSGEERTRKPFRKIYDIILDRYQIIPEKAIFIDDNLENVETATKIGLNGIHFKNADQLRQHLIAMGIEL